MVLHAECVGQGFGFIGIPGGEDLFVHRTSLVGVDALSVVDDVNFVIGFDDRKQKNRAENVTRMEGEKNDAGWYGDWSSRGWDDRGGRKSWGWDAGWGSWEGQDADDGATK